MALSEQFMTDLQTGHLQNLRTFLLSDHLISPEIREDCLTLYYRGGAIASVKRQSNAYQLNFNHDYLNAVRDEWMAGWATVVRDHRRQIDNEDDCIDFLQRVPAFKACMDQYFRQEGGAERELQQQLVRENNRAGSVANSTDYFICDMETADAVNGTRFDLVGVHWPSTGRARQEVENRRLFVSEVKYGTGAIDGNAGLIQHLEGLRSYAANPELLQTLQARMLKCFNQKHQLGLMECANPLKSFDETGFDWVVILINCDPESTRLRRALPDLHALAAQLPSIQVRVATSHFMGFGLWDDSMLDLDVFIKRYGART